MANYFKWVFQQVHAEEGISKDQSGFGVSNSGSSIATSAEGSETASSSTPSPTGNHPWYIIPPPPVFPKLPTYNPNSFKVLDTMDILAHDINSSLHFSAKKEEIGCEGLYGLFYYLHLPDIEVGLDIDVGAFISGALSCTLLGLYLDDIYYPRRLMTWWPTRWFFHFVEEGVYIGRSFRWFMNATVVLTKVLYRAGYGGVTHTFSRMIYYWIRKMLQGGGTVSYAPLFDDTFAALISGYLWTAYTVETDRHTAYDRIIAIGWTAVFAGFVEYCLYQYFSKEPQPGLFRWFLGGGYYGPGIWRYLEMGPKPGDYLME